MTYRFNLQRGTVDYDKEHSRCYPTNKYGGFGFNTWQEYQDYLANKYEEPFSCKCHRHNCAVCGEQFYSRSPYSLYCSGRCRNDAYLERRRKYQEIHRYSTCPVCGNPFNATRRDGKYCSSRCKQSAYRKRVTDYRSGHMTRTDTGNTVTDNRLPDISGTQNGNDKSVQKNIRQLVGVAGTE